MSLKFLNDSFQLDVISQDGWDAKMLAEEELVDTTSKTKHRVTIQCFFSLQFAGNESGLSVVQYSGSQAQEVIRLSGSLGLTAFKQ